MLLFAAALGFAPPSSEELRRDAETPLSFLVLGDWGGSSDSSPTTAAQVANGKGMAAVAANLSAQFIMAVGDNFYSTGIHGDDHAQRFVDTFEKCYTEDPLDLPWYALAGNHDHHGNVSAQIAYTHDLSLIHI